MSDATASGRARQGWLGACPIVMLLVAISVPASAREKPPVDRSTLDGKVLVGYQGWFAPAGDGTGLAWKHYGHKGVFRPGTCMIDMWPDLSGFDADEKYPTEFRHADGSVAHVFSSANPKTVDRHFAWMKQYGIDGAFLQRFGVALTSEPSRKQRERVTENVRRSADVHERLWAMMYDLSGLGPGDIRDVVTEDWKRLAGEQRIRADRTYMLYRGKPLVAVWGIGFRGADRRYSLAECMELVSFLKDDPLYGGNAVMLGVPYHWRDGQADATDDPLFQTILKRADIISPWAVGRFRTPAEALQREMVVAKDLEWTRAHGAHYLPVIFPGFSWHNLRQVKGPAAPFNDIPRHGGQFLWNQAVAAKRAGATTVYVAMFDEIDEGTAIFKVSNDPPAGPSPFLTLDGFPSDHYLWLSGQVGRLLRGEIEPSGALPQRP